MALKIRFTRFTQRPPFGMFVQWTLDGVSPAMNGDFTFSLERSGGPNGPWEPVATGLVNNYAYFDQLPQPPDTSYRNVRPTNMFAFWRDFDYKVSVVAPNGERAEASEISSSGYSMNGRMSGQQRKAIRDMSVSLRLNGTPAALLKRKRWGTRCRCVDKQTREPTLSSCKTCWGTGFVGGYWDPVITNVRRSIPQGGTSVMPEGRNEGSSVRIAFGNTPGLDQGDVFVFFNDGRRYLVDQASSTEFQLGTIHQYATCVELPRLSILYSMVVDPNAVNPWM